MAVAETIKHAIGLGDNLGNSQVATREQMSAEKLPLAYRDSCAHLLIPLNQCRQKEYYLPWRCEGERHEYEKCQFADYTRRMIKQNQLREERGEARSN